MSATAPGGRFFEGMYREADGPDDVLLVSEAERQYARVVVGKDAVTIDGKAVEVSGIGAALRAMRD